MGYRVEDVPGISALPQDSYTDAGRRHVNHAKFQLWLLRTTVNRGILHFSNVKSKVQVWDVWDLTQPAAPGW